MSVCLTPDAFDRSNHMGSHHPSTHHLSTPQQTLAAAMCLYLVIGRRQTPPQMAALALLLTACA